jgi:hypothetical protein
MWTFENRNMDRRLVEDIRSDRWIQKKALTRSFIPVLFNQLIVRKVRGMAHASSKPFERRRHRWEDVIKVDVEGRGCENVNWIHVAQERIQKRSSVNTITNETRTV